MHTRHIIIMDGVSLYPCLLHFGYAQERYGDILRGVRRNGLGWRVQLADMDTGAVIQDSQRRVS